MKSSLRKVFRVRNLVSDEYKPLFSNFFSLGIIQGSNFILPLLTFPFIVRAIGVEQFGMIALVQSVMGYFVVLTDYGFNLTATKEISINRNDKALVSSIFSEVAVTKLLLLFLSFFMLGFVVLLVPKFQAYQLLILYSFPIVLGQVLQPAWFFQGVEKMKYITYINIAVKALYAIGIFIFIRSASDFIYVNLISGISGTIGGIVSLLIVWKKFRVNFNFPGYKQIKKQLTEGWSIFFSSVSVTISNNTNILVLSLFANAYVLGYYSIAEKIFQLLRTFAVIVYQVIYPRVCMLAQVSFHEVSVFLKQILGLVLLFFLPISVAVFLLSDYILYFIAGEFVSEASFILKILCFGPLIAALNIPACHTMLAYRLNKTYATVVSIGAIINVSSNFILAYYFQAFGTAWSIIITELVVTALLYYVLHKLHPQYSLFTNLTPTPKGEKIG